MVRPTIKDTGPLDRRQMKMVDGVFLDRAKQFILQRHAAGKTRLTWVNPSRKHFFTHVKKESQGVTRLGLDAKPAKFNVDEVLKLMSQGPGD